MFSFFSFATTYCRFKRKSCFSNIPNQKMNQIDKSRSKAVPFKTEAAVYGIGLFTTSVFHIDSVIIPLFAYTFNPSPFVFGLVFGASHLLPLLFSIHAGALMDRLGAKRIMLFCTSLTVFLPVIYPLASEIWMLIALQLFLGLSESMGWLGAQTMIGQYMHGRTKYAGRLSFVIRLGQLCAPPMAGLTWDLFGVWGAFILMSIWASGSVFFALALPAQKIEAERSEQTAPPVSKLSFLLPRLEDYVLALGLLRVPGVVVIVALGALMHSGNAVQSSFYVAWLTENGVTGTAIGLLSPAGAIGAALFSLLTTRLMRYVDGFWIVLLSIWAGILLICATPLLGAYFLLQVAMFMRSGLNGLAQPLVITLVLRGAGASNQGKAVGLRGTANRMASILAPLAMGAIAEAVGLELAFYVTGLLLSAIMAALAIYLHRRPDIAAAGED